MKSPEIVLPSRSTALTKEGNLWMHEGVYSLAQDVTRVADRSAQIGHVHDFSNVPVCRNRNSRSDSTFPLTLHTSLFASACHIHPVHIQPKLKISQPDDEYEREADRVAGAVMRMPEPKDEEQEKCPVSGYMPVLQRRATGSETLDEAPPIVHEVLRSPGRPLDLETIAFMEPRFGHDFSRVRVHTDTQAARSAKVLKAQAYAVGQDIVFGAGQYAPAMNFGAWLLAHELAHVIAGSGQSNLQSSTNALTGQAHQKAVPSKTAEPTCKEAPRSMSEEQLKDCIAQTIDTQGVTAPAFRPLARELTHRVVAGARATSEFEVPARVNRYSSELLRQPYRSGAFYVVELYLYVYEHENLRLMRQARLAFPGRKVEQSRHPVPREVRSGHNRCLNAFYHHLENLYSKSELEAIPETEEIRKILMVRDVVTSMQTRHRQDVPQQHIITALAQQGISEERALKLLALMKQMKILETSSSNRWRATGDVGQGLVTKTVESLRREGFTEEKVDLQTPRNRYPKDDSEAQARASDDLARRLLAFIRGWIMPVRSGEYFFALSLHRDYHSVNLRAEIRPEGRMKLFWLDQEGQREVTTRQNLAREIESFWPSYWPTYSTLWPLIPRPHIEEF